METKEAKEDEDPEEDKDPEEEGGEKASRLLGSHLLNGLMTPMNILWQDRNRPLGNKIQEEVNTDHQGPRHQIGLSGLIRTKSFTT